MMTGWQALFRNQRQEDFFPKPERFERKFYIPPSVIPFAAHVLKHCCLADRQYPRSTVHSVYYDTENLEHFEDSQQGCRHRRKVRIRWYDHAHLGETNAPVFLELKSKNGYAGSKQRKKYEITPHQLSPSWLREGPLPWHQVLRTLTEFGYTPQVLLSPMILISYQRLRFTDLATGARVSLDWNICSSLAASKYNRYEGWLRMEGGVIEIKGQTGELPCTLRSIRFLHSDWSRYSKYASCLESQLEESGSAGRFFPSGRMENP